MSAKAKSVYVCQQCGAQSPRWVGRCSECNTWNSLVETMPVESSGGVRSSYAGKTKPIALPDLLPNRFARITVPNTELNRVLGGGIVPGSVVLVGGEPGIGKSTLLLQVSAAIAEKVGPVLYVSGEESPDQIRLRAERLGIVGERLYILGETSLEGIIGQIESLQPDFVVIDSIQTVYLESLNSAAGSISQVREGSMALLRVAKTTNIPIFLVGHVTKDGAIAGPRALEHIVDTVLYLEGERFHTYRLLRSVKNRFGSTNEIGVFEMTEAGMIEVDNPSSIFLAERQENSLGSAVGVTLEGTRPLLVEVQALTTTTAFGLPRRSGNGFDLNRLLMLVAVLSKGVGLSLGNQDIYVNVVGGFKISEPAIDLAVALAIASSYREMPIAPDLVAIGEIGLSGELRRVGQIERRLFEAEKLGFRRCLLPKSVDSAKLPKRAGMELIFASNLYEALEIALGPRQRSGTRQPA